MRDDRTGLDAGLCLLIHSMSCQMCLGNGSSCLERIDFGSSVFLAVLLCYVDALIRMCIIHEPH